MDNISGGGDIADDHPIAIRRHLGNICVLTKTALEVASHRSDGIRETPRQKMIQRFFFNGVDIACNKPSVNQSVKNPFTVFPDTAYSPTTLFYDAPMVAKIAFDLVLLQRLI